MKYHKSASAIGLLAVLAGCAGSSQHVYKLYPGVERPKTELATVTFGDRVCRAKIDDLLVNCLDYGSITVLPGRHCIEFDADFAVSYLVNPAMHDSAHAAACTTLEAGHTYIMRGDRTTGHGYQMFVWIEDADTGVFVRPEESP